MFKAKTLKISNFINPKKAAEKWQITVCIHIYWTTFAPAGLDSKMAKNPLVFLSWHQTQDYWASTLKIKWPTQGLGSLQEAKKTFLGVILFPSVVWAHFWHIFLKHRTRNTPELMTEVIGIMTSIVQMIKTLGIHSK